MIEQYYGKVSKICYCSIFGICAITYLGHSMTILKVDPDSRVKEIYLMENLNTNLMRNKVLMDSLVNEITDLRKELAEEREMRKESE